MGPNRRDSDPENSECYPVYLDSGIQRHGCLLACDADLKIVLRHSHNAGEMLGMAPDTINGRCFRDLIGKHEVHELRNALARSDIPGRPGVVFGMKLETSGRAWDMAVHRGAGETIIEFEPTLEPDCPSPLEVVRTLVGRLNGTADEKQLLDMAVRLVRGLLRYDRVMACKFACNGSGEIVAEAKRADLPGWRGRRFPATESFDQARGSYLRNTVRIIADTRGDRVPIEPLFDERGAPLDLSYAHLRSASPDYCKQLLALDVLGAMSISIITGGKLWGLITCHHYEPKHLSMVKRIAAQTFGDYLSLYLDAIQHRTKAAAVNKARGCLGRMLKNVSMHPNLTTQLKEKIRDLQKLIPCDGVGFWIEGIWASNGCVPPAKAIPALSRFVNGAAQGQVWATHHLSDEFPAASEFRTVASGVIAIPLSQIPRDYLFFFRKENVRTVSWAAHFHEMHGCREAAQGATSWEETIERQSLPWSETDCKVAAAVRTTMLEIILRYNELAATEWRQSELQQKMLNEELNHRVKNILALIKSLVSRPVDTSRSIKDYIMSLSGRVQALSFAHDQAVGGDGGGALRDLLNAELSPYRDPPNRIALDGPDTGLDSAAFSVVALVIHELATNAVKYGALSAKEGQLSVRWEASEETGCDIQWAETGGPPLSPPSHNGFGSALITRSIPFNLGGESEIEFASEGLKARLHVPAKYVSMLSPGQSPVPRGEDEATGENSDPTVAKPLNGARVLLVEDQLIIAMDVENMLTDLGASVVDSAATASEALRKLSSATPDVAVLDVNLGAGTSLTVAEALVQRGIPFVFATGYGEAQLIAGRMTSVPLLRKPYEAAALASALGRCLIVSTAERRPPRARD